MPGRQAVKKAHASISQTSRLGRWLPSDQRHLNDWLETAIETAERKQAPLHPIIREFQEMIELDPVMYMYFTQMFQIIRWVQRADATRVNKPENDDPSIVEPIEITNPLAHSQYAKNGKALTMPCKGTRARGVRRHTIMP